MIINDVTVLIDLLRAKGDAAYFGESVSILEHSLQCAYFADGAASSVVLISAALLHDVGHLLHGEPEDVASHGHDTVHEELAANYLSAWFGAEVTEPIRLHVAAKRYLCATEPEYLRQLSPSSKVSLALQGGPMTPKAVRAFESLPNASAAVQLRRWDDQAKLIDLKVPGLEHYVEHLRAAVRTK